LNGTGVGGRQRVVVDRARIPLIGRAAEMEQIGALLTAGARQTRVT
jgi:hypothetical protein